jgi:hypothetical protein
MSEIEREIQELAALLNRLREVDTHFRVSGADSHKYRVGPKLSESEIQEFEKKHSITLPEDYRLYLKLVGNGSGGATETLPDGYTVPVDGAGPYFGLYPLAETVKGDRVSEPFPFTEKVLIPYEPPYDAWEENVPGIIEIVHQGCQGASYLIVQGDAYGTIWDGYGNETFMPTGLNFREWYRKWAKKAIPLVMKEDVTNAVRIGMTVQEVIKICGDNGRRPDNVEYWILQFEGLHTRFAIDQERGNTITRIHKARINPLSPYFEHRQQ